MNRRGGRQSRRQPGGSSFVPPNLPGLVLWLRSDLGITIGTGVSAWADQSGSGNSVTQATGSAQPTYSASGGPNGLTPALSFNPANAQFLGNASAAPLGGGTTLTMFLVLQCAVTTGAVRAIHIGARPASFNGFAATIAGDAANHRDFELSGVANDVDTTANSTTNWEFWTLQSASGPTQLLHVNGTAHTLSPNNSAPAAPTAGLTIGGLRSTAGAIINFWSGGIAEAIVYVTAQSAGQIATVESYLHARYGL